MNIEDLDLDALLFKGSGDAQKAERRHGTLDTVPNILVSCNPGRIHEENPLFASPTQNIHTSTIIDGPLRCDGRESNVRLYPDMQTIDLTHIITAFTLTMISSTGLLGIGALMRGRTIGERWVLGWTGLWWSVAFTAQFVNITSAIQLGIIAVVLGSGWLLASWLKGLSHSNPNPYRSPLVLFILGTIGAFLWLPPPFFYDTLAYHLGLPWSWIAHNDFSPLPEIIMSYYPVAGQTVYLLPTSLGFPEVAAGLHWMSFAITLLVVTNIAKNLGAGRFAPLAALPICSSWPMLWVAGLATVDHLVTVGIVVAIEALTTPTPCSATESKFGPEIRSWIIAGLGFGLAMASKYPALVVVAAVLGALVMVYPRCVHLATVCFAVALVTSSFNWIRNIVLTNNPIYPLLPTLFDSFSWTEIDAVRYMAYGTQPYGFSALGSGLSKLISPSTGFGWWILILAPVAFMPLVLSKVNRHSIRLLTLSSFMIFSIWMVLTTRLIRFAFPGATLIAILIAVGLNHLSPKLRTWVLIAFGALMLHGIALFFHFTSNTLHMSDLWLQRISAEEWRQQLTLNDPTPAYRYCNFLPEGSKVLVIGEGRPWGLGAQFHLSSAYELQFIEELVMSAEDPANLAATIKENGFTHLLINWAEIARLTPAPISLMSLWSTADELRWRRFLADQTDITWRHELLEIRTIRHIRK